jgi:hypothetical protein
MNYKGITAFCLLLFLPLSARSQFYSTGEDPASVRWMQIRTPEYRLVYPRELQATAFRLLRTLDSTAGATASDFSKSAKPLPILIHNASVVSNGYVTWAPRRMELIATPPQDSYAQSWTSQLGLHEFRHVAQISQLYQGFTSALSWFAGEAGPGMATVLVPSWLYEGDAVWNETVLSGAGRGRSPRFAMPVRALLLDRPSPYSFNKILLGSYRDFVPDHYQYGYQIAGYGRQRFGDSIWSDGINYTARHPYLVIPLTWYLKSRFGLTKSGLYRETMGHLKELYDNTKGIDTSIKYASTNVRLGRTFTSYTLPRDAGEGRVVVYRSGMDKRDAFVTIDSAGNEETLLFTGLTMGLRSDVHGDMLVWDEIARDPRWEGRDYSELRTASLATGRTRRLTTKTRYFSPVFSPDGRTLAVAETDLSNAQFLTIVDVGTGKTVNRFAVPGNRALQFPAWAGSSRIVVVTVDEDGKRMERINIASGEWTVVIPPTMFDISEPRVAGPYIFFRSSYTAVENIFALDTRSNEMFQVTFSQFGAFHPAISRDSTRLIFSDYTSAGYNVVSIPLDPKSWKAFSPAPGPRGIWKGMEASARLPLSKATQAPRTARAEPYRKAAHLFNFHSWLPFYTDLTSLDGMTTEWPVNPGAMLFSQNLLSTVISSIGYEYSGGHHILKPSISWKGWYPVIEASARIGGPVHALPLHEGWIIPSRKIPYAEYTLKTYLPLLYNRGPWVTSIVPRAEYQRTGTWYNDNGVLRKGLNYIHLRFVANHVLRLEIRDLYPRFGGYVSAIYTNTPGDKGLLGSMYTARGILYLPGILRHHHLVLQGGYQKQMPGFYLLGLNRIEFPRGYSSAVSTEFSCFTADYAFTIAYPDLSAGILFYLKRIRADLFYDGAYGTDVRLSGGERYTGVYRSTGLELRADFHLFRLILPMTVGIRVGYPPETGNTFTDFLFGIDTGIF